jgi:hypothetical protein
MTGKITFSILLLCFLSSFVLAQGDNSQDPMVNLGCLETAIVTGSVDTSIAGGKHPDDILWNPATNSYKRESSWHEYGLGYNEIVGDATPENPVWWMCEWPTEKNINYITVTGTYGNQPQPTTGWSVQIDSAGTWVTLAKGQDGWDFDLIKGVGGWVDDGLLQLRLLEPVVTKGIRFCAYANPDSLADGVTTRADSLWSFSWTGLKKSAKSPNACLIQYLDFSSEVADNEMDNMINLGLLDEAVVSSNIKKGELNGEPLDNIRGEPADMLFNPVTGNFHNTNTAWGEFGYPFNYDAGFPTIDEGFYWMVEWPVPKKVNYFTWGGVYGNQPQPETPWELQYWENGDWVTILDGVGGAYADGEIGVDVDAQSVWFSDTPVETNKFRLAVYSDGITPLFSYNFRGRGGSTTNWDETDSTFKAVLLQYIDEPVAVDEENGSSVPNEFSLDQNYPNPFNPTTNIVFSVQREGYVNLSVYDVLGQKVAVLIDGMKEAGSYNVQFDASNLSSGLYFYRLESNQQMITKKMMLLR